MLTEVRAQNGMARMNDLLALSEHLGVSAAYGQLHNHFYLVLKVGREGDVYKYNLFDPFRGGEEKLTLSSDKIDLKVGATKDLRDARDVALEKSGKGFTGRFRKFLRIEKDGYEMRDFLADSGYDLETWFDKVWNKGEIQQHQNDEENCGYLCVYAAKQANIMNPRTGKNVKPVGTSTPYGFVGWARLKLAELKKEGTA